MENRSYFRRRVVPLTVLVLVFASPVYGLLLLRYPWDVSLGLLAAVFGVLVGIGTSLWIGAWALTELDL